MCVNVLYRVCLTKVYCCPFCSSAGADMERSGTGWDEIYYSEMQVRIIILDIDSMISLIRGLMF